MRKNTEEIGLSNKINLTFNKRQNNEILKERGNKRLKASSIDVD